MKSCLAMGVGHGTPVAANMKENLVLAEGQNPGYRSNQHHRLLYNDMEMVMLSGNGSSEMWWL